MFGSFFTQAPFYLIEASLFSSVTFIFFYIYNNFIFWQLPINWYWFILTIVVADFIYYVQHRLVHGVRILWVAHSVHHSSQVMNTSSAFRFSIIDPFISIAIHLPLIFLGFNPVFVIAAELFVQIYQFWIHTDLIPRLGFLEKIINTPSNHRVHHSIEIDYRDSNYGGIFMIWDRIFGTYKEEDKKIIYGIPDPINAWNPLEVQFHDFPRLRRELANKSFGDKIKYLFSHPGKKL